MARISENNFTTLQENRMIVGWVSHKARFDGYFAKDETDRVQLSAIRHTVARSPGRQPAEES